jgi:hypothetical protein
MPGIIENLTAGAKPALLSHVRIMLWVKTEDMGRT